MKFAVVDLETTGGRPATDRIVEIGIVLLDEDGNTQRFRSLVNPGTHIPYQVTLIHGITTQMVAESPSFEALAEKVLSLTKDRIFVAHNVNFDYNFLKEEFRRLNLDFDRKKICSARLAKKLLPELKSHSLKNLCRFYGVVNARAHRALEDAEATTEILVRLRSLPGAESIIKQLLTGRSGINLLPANIPYGRLEALPEEPGVYLFHDAKGKVIYVGKAINLRDRVAQHFSGHTHTRQKTAFLDSIFDLSYEVSGHEMMALLMENELIKKHYPRFNSTNKDFRLNYGIFRFEDQKGYQRLVIGQAGKWARPEMVFRTMEEATTHLLKTSMRFGLCLKMNQLMQPESAQCQYQTEEGTQCLLCQGKAEPDQYNASVSDLVAGALNGKSLVLKTKGRKEGEEGIVWIEKGKIMGKGFVPVSTEKGDLTTLKSNIQAYYDTQDAQSIVRSWLEKAKPAGWYEEGIPIMVLA